MVKTPKKAKPKAAPAKPKPAATPPAAPQPVAPYSTAADLQQFNDWITQYSTSLEDIDNQLAGLTTDTTFQKGQNDKTAKENTSLGQDAMAARGLFQSSVKDAALFDIEATRALSNKFLDDKLTAATLQAGTRKQTLGESKKRFDEAYALHQGENAAAVNGPAQAAWADQMATFNAAKKPLAPSTPAPRIAAAPAAPHAVNSYPQPASPKTAWERQQAEARRRTREAARRARGSR